MNDTIKYININNIYQHPDNPRKDLGDLTELSESIKKSGIMQNLTVMPISSLNSEPEEQCDADNISTKSDFYVLIGHRRLAASKMAGLTEVPCRIVSRISRKEQVGIMLEENMQRNDLTIWEQAQGFQMMLDLGDTEEQIAEKTGFSRTTIRHRLNIAKLDMNELKKKEQDSYFQLNLNDLYVLEKVKDIKTRNRILKESSDSKQIAWKARLAVEEAERDEKAKVICELLIAAGLNKAPESAQKELYSGKWETVKTFNLDGDIPKRLNMPKDNRDEMMYLRRFRNIEVIKKVPKKPQTDYDRKQKEKRAKSKQIDAIMKALNTRKRDFIMSLISKRMSKIGAFDKIQDEIWKTLVQLKIYISMSNMQRFFTDKSDYECTSEEKEAAESKVKELSVFNQMLIMLNYAIDNSGNIYDYNMQISANVANNLKRAYDILEYYGFTLEESEQQLLDGTHELYEKKMEET